LFTPARPTSANGTDAAVGVVGTDVGAESPVAVVAAIGVLVVVVGADGAEDGGGDPAVEHPAVNSHTTTNGTAARAVPARRREVVSMSPSR
jgi:hypothetical protein